MVARGADRLIAYGAGDPAALAPLAARVAVVRR
jgi:hypothetical protein